MDIKKLYQWWVKSGRPGRNQFPRQYKKDFKGDIKNCKDLILKLRAIDEIQGVNDLYKEKDYKRQDIINFYSDEFLKYIKEPKSENEILEKYGINKIELANRIKELDTLYNIEKINKKYKLSKDIVTSTKKSEFSWDGNNIIKFGVVSDNHLCNKNQQLSFLHDLYNLFEKENVDCVYNAGDVCDGYYKNRPEHVYELIPGKIGVDDQCDYIAEMYPVRDGITTYMISGNHDETHIKNGGADILKRVQARRQDIKYLGIGNAIINLTPNTKLEIIHPLDGSSYATSYASQRYVDSLQGGEKPNILIMGHHHKALYFIHRNIHILEAGTTCGTTSWMKRKRIMSNIGGWLITLHLDLEGSIIRFLAEFIPLYKIKKDDY